MPFSWVLFVGIFIFMFFSVKQRKGPTPNACVTEDRCVYKMLTYTPKVYIIIGEKIYMLFVYPTLRGMYNENDGNTQALYMRNAAATLCALGKASEIVEL